jgi:hypothetical protein
VSFLAPLLLASSVLVGVPLWLHLRARAAVAHPFAALRFLEDRKHPRRQGFRIRDVLLLAARALAVLAIAAAFAWPYFEKAAPTVVESRVLLLDNTLSGQAGGGFAERRARVAADLRQAPPEVRVAVIELTSRPRVVAAFADDHAEAALAVEALPASFQRGSYLESFRLADTLLTQSLGGKRRIVVYGDQQENQWSENASSPPFLRDVETVLAEPPRVQEQMNLAMGAPSARRVFVGDKALAEVSALLRHPGRGHATVVVEANGRRIAREVLALAGAPSLLTVSGRFEADPGQWLQGEVRIEDAGDTLAADDRVYFCLPPVREGRLALLARSPYLLAALHPRTMRGRWNAHPLDPTADLLAVDEKDMADVLVLESDYAQSQRVRDLAFRYLNNGRGVVLFTSRVTPSLGPFLEELGLHLVGPGKVPEVLPDDRSRDGLRFLAADHPVFKPFAGGELGDPAEPLVRTHLRLQPRQATPLAFSASGDGLLFEGGATKGRLLVFPFAMDRAQTDWPLHPAFIPLLDLCLQHVRAEAPLETSSLPGQAFVHVVPKGRAVGEVVLRAGPEVVGRSPVDEQRQARLPGPLRPGIYTIAYDSATTAEALFAVNPAPQESVLRYVADPQALAAWALPPGTSVAQAETAALPSALRSALSQRLWWWLLCAAALALALESGELLRRQERA